MCQVQLRTLTFGVLLVGKGKPMHLLKDKVKISIFAQFGRGPPSWI